MLIYPNIIKFNVINTITKKYKYRFKKLISTIQHHIYVHNYFKNKARYKNTI